MRHITSQMENMNMQSEQNSLVSELAQGRELARQLQIHLNVPASSDGTKEMLVQRIIVSYEKALSMLSSSSSVLAGEQQLPTGVARMIESPPHSLNVSPGSDDSDREFKDQDHRDPSRKRKIMPRWTQQIRVTSGMGLEGPLDDGFSWRKYGQKDILGAKYPRGYYRCTHRNVQGCFATKQVQRSDHDPSIFDITYRGRHTCSQASPTSSSLPDQRPEVPHKSAVEMQQNQQHSQRGTLLSLPEGLRVITEGLDSREDLLMNKNIGGSFSPPSFMAPETSGTDYFSVALSQQGFGGNNNFHQNAETTSAATSATNSPTVGLDFPFGQPGQLYPHFTFGEPGFFS